MMGRIVMCLGYLIMLGFTVSLQAFTVINRTSHVFTVFVFGHHLDFKNFSAQRDIRVPKNVIIKSFDRLKKNNHQPDDSSCIYLEPGHFVEIIMDKKDTRQHNVCAYFLKKSYGSKKENDNIEEKCFYHVSSDDEFSLDEEIKFTKSVGNY